MAIFSNYNKCFCWEKKKKKSFQLGQIKNTCVKGSPTLPKFTGET